MTDPTQDALPLPGFDQPARPPSSLEAAVRRTVAALGAKDQIDETHALDLELMLRLASIITDKERSRKTSTVHADARLLWEIRNSFTDEEAGVDERLRDAMEQLSHLLDLEAEETPP